MPHHVDPPEESAFEQATSIDAAAARGPAADARDSSAEDGLERASIDPAVWWSILPVLIFWATRQIASSQVAIGAGFATAVIVFYINRKREKGILAWIALAGLVIVSGSAIAGLILDSEKAYLANDPIGDGITVLVALGSVLIGKPIIGLLACEIFPRLTRYLHYGDRVFVQITLMLAAKDLTTGVARVFLLDSLDTDGYLIFSRVVSWPINAVFFYLAYRMIQRANREARPAAQRPTRAG